MSKELINKEQLILNFNKAIIDFLDEIIELFPSQAEDLIALRVYLSTQIKPEEIINYVIKEYTYLFPIINERNERQLVEIEFSNILKNLENNKYKDLWKKIDNDTKNTIWQWLDKFIYIINKYQKKIQEELKI